MENRRARLYGKTFSTISEKIFPGLSTCSVQTLNSPEGVGTEALSSLPLQMALYFSVIFFPVWLSSMTVMFHFKYGCLTVLYRFLVSTVLLTAAVNECLRLYFGYIGNLSDKVPELAGFWLLSLVPQLPLQLFLLLNQNIMLQPLEQIVQSFSVLLLIIQLLTGFFALRHSSKIHAEQSRLRVLFSTQQKDD
ncbi:transmembrane protein 17-like isoform X1 [Schistocerca gregaria]|uniref:transmembrane protein 17-like isoform X1 n=1 Tax=Schistocerca gregaria TaxID=7010 RepID=UPI00211EA37F|nr:transmembrane protein 17-like isoform X1 [Schistocerca gregaria]XP_049830040.1 transmembrane protein 17-like isoform X1 [Schistocerca gregaria]XP_049830041.1 transmembrane protein 17-like isoform X1 [Schistocerca gregaria]XP_049830042.1 transmembrane protein 17-like isoform X1 [Schistocerca gregaria]